MEREGHGASVAPPAAMGAPPDPFQDMTVGLGEHNIFDDKFSFGEDPHTEFNQLDDVRVFRVWMRETLSSILRNARQTTNRPPSCEKLWDQTTWNSMGRGKDVEAAMGAEEAGNENGKKRRRSRRAAAGKGRRNDDF